MKINWSKLRSTKANQVVTALLRDGFIERKTSGGSHRRFIHKDGRRVTVAAHGTGGTFLPKTLKSIIEKQARWNEVDLVRLGLLR